MAAFQILRSRQYGSPEAVRVESNPRFSGTADLLFLEGDFFWRPVFSGLGLSIDLHHFFWSALQEHINAGYSSPLEEAQYSGRSTSLVRLAGSGFHDWTWVFQDWFSQGACRKDESGASYALELKLAIPVVPSWHNVSIANQHQQTRTVDLIEDGYLQHLQNPPLPLYRAHAFAQY